MTHQPGPPPPFPPGGPPPGGALSGAALDAALPGRSDPEGWRRLHKITPLLRGWQVVLVAAFIAVQQGLSAISGLFTGMAGAGILGLLILGFVLLVVVGSVGGFAYLSWRMTKYRVREDSLQVHSGVLFRQQRQVRLDRLQAIDVVQPLLGRIFGLAELKIEVAGGAGSDAKLAYLRLDDAERLRNVLLAHAAGVSFEGEAAPAAPEQFLVELPTGRLVESIVRSWVTAMVVVMVVLFVIVAVVGEWAVLTGAVPAVLGGLAAAWAGFSGAFGFRAAASPDGLRLRHGLLETRSQTVPPGRVQAVKLTQPLLWRGRDWWRLRVNIAGYTPDGEGKAPSNVLMPVATREEAFVLLAQVLPVLGHPRPRDLIDAGLTGLSVAGTDPTGLGYVCAPPRSAWLDPVSWRRHAVAVSEHALIIRSGRLRRRLILVPHARTQSLGLQQGPLQRRLGLASFALHSTPGPVTPTVQHLLAPVAAGLLREQARRARLARAAGGPERWMRKRPATPEPDTPGQTPGQGPGPIPPRLLGAAPGQTILPGTGRPPEEEHQPPPRGPEDQK